MSYFVRHEVQCDKCDKKISNDFRIYNDKFGNIDNIQIITPIKDCECGGKFKRIENYLE